MTPAPAPELTATLPRRLPPALPDELPERLPGPHALRWPRPPATTDRAPLIEAHDLTRRWGRGAGATLGVDRVDLSIDRGELAAVVGPSGSGKSTLGALIAGIDRPTSGSLVVDGARIDQLSDDQLARWRGRTVGIVFQNFHLLPTLTAAENVELALKMSDRSVRRGDRRDRARQALTSVGLDGKAKRLPAQLSGGEQQRVAVARALVVRPRLIVADEPTGSLDQASGHAVFDLLAGLGATGATVLLITHDRQLADEADRVVEMLDGAVTAVDIRHRPSGTRPAHPIGVR
jgi:putative ABC transport system ATP-binding protein